MKKATALLSLKATYVVLLLAAAGPTPGQSPPPPYFYAHVTGVLMTADDTYGGCMAALSVDPQTVRPNCTSGWVTFSCSGDFTDPVRAYRMLDQAQLALATGKDVLVMIQDNKSHNGYCFANRIDVY